MQVKETEAERAKRYRKEHPEVVKATVKRFYEKNKDKKMEYTREYRKKNPDKVKKWNNDSESRRTRRYKDDPIFYIWRSAKIDQLALA